MAVLQKLPTVKGGKMPSGIYVRTEEHRKNMSKAQQKYETRNKISKALKGERGSLSLEHRNKISKTLKGRTLSSEHKRNLSKAGIKYWDPLNDNERRKKMSKSAHIAMKSSSIEKKVKLQLLNYGIKFIQQKCLCGGKFYLDFWLPEYQLVIECNGDYWHSLPRRVERDQRLEEYVLSKGKDILWLWEHEINDEWFDVADYIEV